MEKILPIGSVVRLKNGTQKIMIINRGALFNHEGTIGYFDYSACIYPLGQTEQTVHFFNEEDIEEIFSFVSQNLFAGGRWYCTYAPI